MTPKEKAKDLIDKFYPYSCGFIGSSFLTNTEYPEQKLKEYKEMALICVDELMKHEASYHSCLDKTTDYLKEVKLEIENYEL